MLFTLDLFISENTPLHFRTVLRVSCISLRMLNNRVLTIVSVFSCTLLSLKTNIQNRNLPFLHQSPWPPVLEVLKGVSNALT